MYDGSIPPIDVGQFSFILRRQPSENFFFIYIVAINKLNNKLLTFRFGTVDVLPFPIPGNEGRDTRWSLSRLPWELAKTWKNSSESGNGK